jgi:hypothetical protein
VYSPEPNIAIGIVFGIIASVIAGVAWVAIASATHLTIGYMALGVGALVGWAVATGVRAPGPTGGIISVILSVLTILGAELLTLNPEHMEGLLFTVLFAFIGARWAYGIGSGSGMARRP